MGTATERSSNSSMTSTSHTMTACPPQVNGNSVNSKMALQNSNLNPWEALIANLQPENIYSFLTPSKEANALAGKSAKNLLDGLAGEIYEEQKSRAEAKKQERKRKREVDVGGGNEVLKIRKIVTEGFGTSHVWEQTRRVIDALDGEVERAFESLDVEDEGNESGFYTEEEENSGEIGIEDEEESAEEESDEEEGGSEEELDEEQMAALEVIEAGFSVGV